MSDDDKKAFADATRDVRRLPPSDRAPPHSRKPRPRARQSRAAAIGVLDDSLSAVWQETVTGEVEFNQPWVSSATVRKLRSGRFSIEAELDLHGMTRTQARRELREFVAECVSRGIGCVRIVHGKGSRSGPEGPVLKVAVQEWLARWDEVLAYSSARVRHGGNGALYVLLRRR